MHSFYKAEGFGSEIGCVACVWKFRTIIID